MSKVQQFIPEPQHTRFLQFMLGQSVLVVHGLPMPTNGDVGDGASFETAVGLGVVVVGELGVGDPVDGLDA